MVSLFSFLLLVLYLCSSLQILIWVPYSGSLFGFIFQIPTFGSLIRFLIRFHMHLPYLYCLEFFRKSECRFSLSFYLYSSFWRLKGFSVLFLQIFCYDKENSFVKKIYEKKKIVKEHASQLQCFVSQFSKKIFIIIAYKTE